MFKWGGGVLRGSTLPYLALTMIDVAICLELPTRVEHPPKWCIVGGVIYDDGPLWCLAGAYCAGRVWHGRPRSEQDRDVQAAWPEQCLMGLSLKRAKQQGSTCWGAMDTLVQCGTMGGGVVVDTCHKVWVGLTMMKQNVCHLSVSVLGWGGKRVGCRVEEGVDGRQGQKWRQLKFPPVCYAWPLLLSLFNLTSCLRCGGWKWRGAGVVVEHSTATRPLCACLALKC